MSGLNAATARIVRGRVLIGLTVASSTLANAVERLCDHDLSDADRERTTDQLYGVVADLRLALADLDELVGSSEPPSAARGIVLRVSQSRFRQHRWCHRL